MYMLIKVIDVEGNFLLCRSKEVIVFYLGGNCMSKDKKDFKIFFIPWISSESAVFLILAALCIPIMFFGIATVVAQKTIGPYISEIFNSYLCFLFLPMFLIFKPEQLATSFGTEKLEESQIQQFFEQPILNVEPGLELYFVILFALLMLMLILRHYYKNGIIKSKFRWIIRVVVLNVAVTIPLWYWIYVNIVDTKTQIFMQFFLKHLQAVEESYNRYCYEAFFCCTRILYIQI